MAEKLYIFVDESGHHSRGEHYTVASCWCLSKNSPQNVLNNARRELTRYISNTDGFGEVGELKGTQLPKDKIGSFLETFERFIYDDGTVADPPYPWQDSRPLRCSYHDCNPELGKQILSKYMPEVDAPGALQRLALARILSPLTDADTIDLETVSEIHLVPDAHVWETPADEVCELLEDNDGPAIEMETRDSSQTPESKLLI
ncbi:hypothetical protein [Halorussus caseinilyticus]|uniref:DUF3800 domain-containing protein n=1 Tax=Halorussus caseinilyticus TaxID=3034025 RepID=A0ABD5WTX7_9EURY